MATPIMIPKLGVSMTEGTLVEWLVADGDAVSPGAPIYRLETDKVESDIEAPAAGRIRILAGAGDTYSVGTLVAEVTESEDNP
jgi:pyruvate/2-oxoglutarate dehydrogenase complex dihydrolipoamide acyltransferase (E2) component